MTPVNVWNILCLWRHRDHHQHQPEALLPRDWHWAICRHPGGRVSRSSQVAQFSNRKCAASAESRFHHHLVVVLLSFGRQLLFMCLNICGQISDDGRYAVLSITEGCEPVNQLWYCDLQQLPDGIKGLFVTTTCNLHVLLGITSVLVISVNPVYMWSRCPIITWYLWLSSFWSGHVNGILCYCISENDSYPIMRNCIKTCWWLPDKLVFPGVYRLLCISSHVKTKQGNQMSKTLDPLELRRPAIPPLLVHLEEHVVVCAARFVSTLANQIPC